MATSQEKTDALDQVYTTHVINITTLLDLLTAHVSLRGHGQINNHTVKVNRNTLNSLEYIIYQAKIVIRILTINYE